MQQSGSFGLVLALGGILLLAFLVWLLPLLGTIFRIIACLLVGFGLYSTLALQETSLQISSYGQSESFSQALLDTYQKEGRPVFVNATAAWCITCKVNERVALKDEGVLAHLAEHNIAYLVADWTNQNEEIRRYLESFGRNGVPLYVYYPPNAAPRVLPQLLTPDIVLDALQP